ncbi:hypothetical protein HPB51_009695 [Rhipicephalus microplus]|uniref:Histone deacetylase complex subunit SAP30 Sin3 binding domain-containing protein n=1 Tax=Rhipicephalus microplus TaxID=6941 RepID=A0A9J6ESS9_RHIMP|nr:hypothetical protein HPB51_009695 [Rhipicephalus microplus]
MNSVPRVTLPHHFTIEECQSSCDRIAIMADGQLTCLATLQQLRDKYARGYRLEFGLENVAQPNATKQLKEAVQRHFAGIKLVEAFEVHITYLLTRYAFRNKVTMSYAVKAK